MSRIGYMSDDSDAWFLYPGEVDPEETCIVCERPGPLVTHEGERMCEECVQDFEDITDNLEDTNATGK